MKTFSLSRDGLNATSSQWRRVVYLSASLFLLFGQAGTSSRPHPEKLPQIHHMYPAYKQNQRNYWLEYSTPKSTTFADYYYEDYQEPSTPSPPPPPPKPFFTDGPRLNGSQVQAPLGSTVMLDCRVEQLMDYQVSWFRQKGPKLDLLTVGRSTFSADERYTVKRSSSSSSNWRLRIKPALKRDNGTYVCQISTHPPEFIVTHLRIIVPYVRFVDEESGGDEISEKHYKPGSTIELHCVIVNYLDEFGPVQWSHGGQGRITKQSKRGGVSIKTLRSGSVLHSHLYLATAANNDSGIYTCSIHRQVASASLSLHILNGEEPAAIQSSSANKMTTSKAKGLLLLCLLSFHYYFSHISR